MITARFFISSPENSPPGSLYGHPTVITEPPHELLGQFLTAEIDSRRCPLFKVLPKVLAQVESGELSRYHGGGEGHVLAIAQKLVRIETIYSQQAIVVEILLDDFREVLDQWTAFVRQHEAAQK